MPKKYSPEHWLMASVLFEIDRAEGKLKPYQKNGLATTPDDYMRKAWYALKKEENKN